MRTWLKHRKDRIRLSVETYTGLRVIIVTGSRHDTRGKLQGYIVRVIAGDYKETYFQMGYKYREVVEQIAASGYFCDCITIKNTIKI